MKKFVIAAAILMSSSMAIMSCDNGAYDADPNTNNNGVPPIGFPGGGGSGGGGNNSFNWTGTDPLSAKIDGTPFQATGSANAAPIIGFIMVTGGNSAGDFQILVPETIAANTIMTFNTQTFANYLENSTDYYTTNTAQGGSGAIKIVENDATHIKGYFYGVFKKAGGGSKTVTEGYFNAAK